MRECAILITLMLVLAHLSFLHTHTPLFCTFLPSLQAEEASSLPATSLGSRVRSPACYHSQQKRNAGIRLDKKPGEERKKVGDSPEGLGWLE